MKKQFFALLIVGLLVMSLSFCFAASKFPDTVNTKYDTAAESLSSKGVIKGYPDGTFKPGDPVTRAEMCVMIVNGLGLKKTTDLPMLKFSDINLTDKTHWGYEYIKILSENGLISGYPDGTFKPDNNITYAEVMSIIVRGMGLESKMTDKSWPNGWMNEASKQGILNNVTYSDPNANAIRGEIAISVYNMVNAIEKQKLEEELAKKEAEKQAEKQAKENELDFGIVNTVSFSKSDTTIKFYDDKTKYSLYSISGKSSFTESKAEDLKENCVGYQEGKNGVEVEVIYTPASFDNAKVISSISNKVIKYKDNTTWDTANSTQVDKYKYYTMIRIEASADEDDGEITFDSVKKYGFGLSSITFAKSERILIDESNKVIVALKGISASDTIKKGKIKGSSSDTSDYEYGWVKSTRTKSSTKYVTIGKTEYEAYSKTSFEEDTFVVFTKYKEGSDYDIIKFVKDYGVQDLDGNAKIVTSVNGSKKGSQTIRYKGDSSDTDYYTTSNQKKYEDYEVVEITVKEDKNGDLYVSDYETSLELDDILFKVGDRTVIDTSKEVFVIFHGLSASDTYKDGSAYVAVQYTVKYNWKTGSDLGLGDAPADKKVTSGTSITVWKPTVPEGYTLTLKKGSTAVTPGSSLKITANTTIDIYYEKNKTELEKAYDKMQDALTAWNNAKTEEANKKTAMEKASGDVATAQEAYDTADEEYQTAKSAFEADDGSDPEVTSQLLETMNSKASIRSSKKSILDSKTTTFNNAKSAYINAQKATANKEAAYEEAKAAWMALAEEE